jgi:hypothetical protein
MINAFLDWAQEQQNGASSPRRASPRELTVLGSNTVWIVSNEQLLDWVQHPVPVSQLDRVASLHCVTPQVDPGMKICNGIPANEAGLLSHCAFEDFPFYTCVSCISCPGLMNSALMENG